MQKAENGQEESAPVGLDWLSASLGHILTRLDLGKIMIDLVLFFSNTLVEPKVLICKKIAHGE